MSLGAWQIALIALIVILLFGADKLPRLMGDAGKGINTFKKNLKDDAALFKNGSMAAEFKDVVSDSNKKSENAKAKPSIRYYFRRSLNHSMLNIGS